MQCKDNNRCFHPNWVIKNLLRFSVTNPEPTLGYGLLYNWYAATDVRGVAPDGFRVPLESDFIPLLSIDRVDLKSTRLVSVDGQPGWNDGFEGNNITQWNAFAAGSRVSSTGLYNGISFLPYNWASDISNNGFYRAYRVGSIGSYTNPREGFSIRCVSDTEPATTLVTDNDGNSYSWVLIGTQYWLQQSLKTTTYNNGDSIVTDLDDAAWIATTNGAWAYPNGDSNLPI